MSPGVATNFWTASGFVPPVRRSLHPARASRPKARAGAAARWLKFIAGLLSKIDNEDRNLTAICQVMLDIR
jgi:hypothetical protein